MGFTGYVAIFLVLALLERWFEHRYSRRAERGDVRMKWSFVALHYVYLAVYALTALECFFWERPGRWWVSVAGLALFFVAMAVRLSAIRTLGRFWSLDLEIRREHQLVTEGIYAHVRHPAYASIMIEMVAVPMVGNAYGALVFGLVVYVPLLLMRWSREEREMVNKFGDRYVAYQRLAPPFFPWPRKWRRMS
jgi:protein-S-isoprenylcysteine O-methyltransferase Ste14